MRCPKEGGCGWCGSTDEGTTDGPWKDMDAKPADARFEDGFMVLLRRARSS